MPRLRAPSIRALTLIEMMVVVAVIALLMAVLIVFLMPSDDRKCRLEAERLAAYMTGAASEADIRDAAVRVACAFDRQACGREASRLGAALHEPNWEKDERAPTFEMRKPVRLSAILTSTSGELTGGTGWIVFDRVRSPGGVAVLECGEAVYSVVVPPRGGEVTVVKGRSSVPAASQPPAHRELLPSFALQGNDFLDDPAPPLDLDPPPPTRPSDPPPPIDDPPPEVDDPPPEEPPPEEPPPEETFPPPEEPPEEPPPTPDAGQPEEEEPTCTTRLDCPDPEWYACHNQQCVADIPAGLSYRVIALEDVAPPGLGDILKAELNNRIADGTFNLTVRLDGPQTGVPGREQRRQAWVAYSRFESGAGVRPTFRNDPELPAYLGTATPITGSDLCAADFDLCYQIEVRDTRDLSRLKIFLPQFRNGAVCYRSVTVAARVIVRIRTGSEAAELELIGGIREESARTNEVFYNGERVTLKRLLDSQGLQPTWDSDALSGTPDGIPDAYEFGFTANSSRVELAGNLAAAPDSPQNICP